MYVCMKKNLLLRSILLFSVCFLLFSGKSQAANLANVKDTITTSRPSASSVITANQAANATQVTIVENNSIFLASDSATFRPDTGESINAVTVASMSAANTPAANQRIVYFNSTVSNTHHNGDPVVVPVSSMHTVQFTTANAIPASGKIVLTFPALTSGDANNAASPSATTFQLNGLASGQISYKLDGTRTCTWAFTAPTNGTSPIITCTMDSGGTLAAGTTVTFLIGCGDGSSNETSCTTPANRIINPTTNSTTAGTARIWQLNIQTQDTNSVDIDSAKIKIATVDSVLVQATVDPTLTVTIAGVNTNTNLNTTSGCASETTNSGINSTATTVNLGNLTNTVINLAAQTITVSTNANFGYTITATSSGRLIDPSTGYYVRDANGGNGLTANDTPAPAVLPTSSATSDGFGISPCGTRPPTSSPPVDWDDESAIALGSGAKLSNPWSSTGASYYATLASYTGPVAVAGEKTAIRYAATINETTPAGLYFTVFTYVVTPAF